MILRLRRAWWMWRVLRRDGCSLWEAWLRAKHWAEPIVFEFCGQRHSVTHEKIFGR